MAGRLHWRNACGQEAKTPPAREGGAMKRLRWLALGVAMLAAAGAAGRVLGGMGPRAREAVPVLVAVVQDQMADLDLRAEAAEALGRIGPDPTQLANVDPIQGVLAAALDDGSVRVRRGAARGLEE